MKKLHIICLIFALFCANFNEMYAQQPKTAYEQKVLEIKKKYIKKLFTLQGKWTPRTEKEMARASEYEIDATLGMVLMGAYIAYPNEVENIKTELKQAEKLKTTVDFQREEAEKALKEVEIYAKSDAGIIRENVKTAFEKWNKKGEFEKETDYDKRLKNQSQKVFSQICIEQIKSRIDNLNYNYNLEKELSTYNTADEIFTISFKINNVKWQNQLKVPIADAENFKKNWTDWESEIDIYDWCFVANALCPTVVSLHDNNSNAEFLLPLESKAIAYSFNDLKTDNSYLKGYVFKYSDAKLIAQQQISTYNNRLDSIFQDYNRQLLQSPYNLEKKTMSDYEKVKSNGNLEKNFENCIKLLKNKFEEQYANIVRELEAKNPSKFIEIYYQQNPAKKTEADKMYLECRCHYKSRNDFDLKFISGGVSYCRCRGIEYDSKGNLFASKDEFDSFYDKGDDILQTEIAVRELSKFKNIKSVDLKDIQNLYSVRLNSDSEEARAVSYYVHIKMYKGKPYYSKIIDFMVEINNGLNKEWVKNGENFDNKIEFYEAYVSGNYKDILKVNKKKQK